MGKAERDRNQSARETIAARQASAHRAEQRTRALIVGGSVVAEIAVLVALIVVRLLRGSPPAVRGPNSGGLALFTAAISQLTSDWPANVCTSTGATSATGSI